MADNTSRVGIKMTWPTAKNIRVIQSATRTKIEPEHVHKPRLHAPQPVTKKDDSRGT